MSKLKARRGHGMRYLRRASVLLGALACAHASLASAAVDLSGAWSVKSGRGALKARDGAAPPLNEAGQALYQRNLSAGGRESDGVRRCIPPGLPRVEAMSPFRIVQDQDVVGFVYEWNHLFRLAWIGGQHETIDDVAYLGDNIARWEGDTLVVEVTRLNDATRLDDALPHSESLRLTQRYSLQDDGRTLALDMTFEDPIYYARPWTAQMSFERLPAGADLAEDVCSDRVDIF